MPSPNLTEIATTTLRNRSMNDKPTDFRIQKVPNSPIRSGGGDATPTKAPTRPKSEPHRFKSASSCKMSGHSGAHRVGKR